jgi:hypothetical protein
MNSVSLQSRTLCSCAAFLKTSNDLYFRIVSLIYQLRWTFTTSNLYLYISCSIRAFSFSIIYKRLGISGLHHDEEPLQSDIHSGANPEERSSCTHRRRLSDYAPKWQ